MRVGARTPVCMVFVLLPLWCAAVEPYEPRIADPVLEPWRWREVEELGGLGVLCMDEDSDGTLWFGCIGGLVRYDGLHVQRIRFDEEAKVDAWVAELPTQYEKKKDKERRKKRTDGMGTGERR